MRLYYVSVVLGSTLLVATAGWAANVDVKVNIGAPPVVVREVVPSPQPTRTVIIEDIPEFVYPDPLGFYVAVGTPYDLIFLDGYYYQYRDHKWHRGNDYNGPWKIVREKHLPYAIRKHRFETIRQYRDREHVIYQRDRDQYRGRHFRPDKEWKERRKHEKKEWKEDRKDDRREWKEDRKEDRRDRKDERKDDRRHERDEFRDDHGHRR